MTQTLALNSSTSWLLPSSSCLLPSSSCLLPSAICFDAVIAIQYLSLLP